MAALFTSTGRRVELTTEIGSGGEGTVYLTAGDPSVCAKVYTKGLAKADLRKLELMVGNPPRDPAYDAQQRHRSITWPTALLYRDPQRRECTGILMPKIDTKLFRKALSYFHASDRAQELGGAFNWKYLYTTALNLASAVAAIHDKGYCIGDLNESNVLIAPSTLITVIDCDSFQVKDPRSGVVFRCPVGRDEYAAPEAQLGAPGKSSYRDFDRTPEMDCFALATMIFQLLMDGTHPYQAKGKLVDDAPTTKAKILRGHFPYGERRSGIAPPDHAPPFEILAPELRALFRRCFVAGHRDPRARPTAREWVGSFKALQNKFQRCQTNPNHWFLNHLRACPWCDIARAGRDLFPRPVGEQIALEDPTGAHVSVDRRVNQLRSYVEMAVADGFMTTEENEYLIAKGSELQLPRKRVEGIIEAEARKAKAKSVEPESGLPRLEISKTKFEFRDVRVRSTGQGGFALSNVGGGVLRGSIASNRKWLKVPQSKIDTSRHKQDVVFLIDAAGLRLGSKQMGAIEVQSNGGIESVAVHVFVELTDVAMARLRIRVTALGVLAAVLLGYPMGLDPISVILWAMGNGLIGWLAAKPLLALVQRTPAGFARGVGITTAAATLLLLIFMLALRWWSLPVLHLRFP